MYDVELIHSSLFKIEIAIDRKNHLPAVKKTIHRMISDI